MELVDWLTLGVLAFSLAIFYIWGRFTWKLIKQHYDINSLLYAMEEAEKDKEHH